MGSQIDIQQIWHSQLQPSISRLMRNEPWLATQTHAAIYTTIYNINYTRTSLHTTAAYAVHIYEAAPNDGLLVLDYYDSEWTRFSRGAVAVDRLVQRDNGRRDVAVTQWKMNMFDPISPRMEALFDVEDTHVATLRTKLTTENLRVADVGPKIDTSSLGSGST
ncbi:hypothetical protein B0H14DRAFT_2733171 [Mycena olivaceomarginata]|nr:hypothetical protein B0H14DRAFT_2733171 [Mycena olivaceomarginata]